MPFMKPENPQPTETRKPLDKKHTLNHGKDRSTVCVCVYIYSIGLGSFCVLKLKNLASHETRQDRTKGAKLKTSRADPMARSLWEPGFRV